jgi:NTP pyrophosphatase (non-canonical NTP hydrolase)
MSGEVKTFETYQVYARHPRLPTAGVTYALLNFAAEVGECLGKVAKFIRDGGDREKLKEDLKKELGDVLWHIAAVADDHDLSLEEIAQANIEKLLARKANGTIQGSGDDR